MYRKEWRVVYRQPNALLERLYINGFGTERYRFNGRAMPIIRGGSDPTYYVTADADDGIAYAGSLFTTTSDSLVTGWYNDGEDSYLFESFIRWQGVTLSGTVAEESYIECYGDTETGFPELKVYGVDEDNPAAPTSYAEFYADALTDASVDWDYGDLGINDWFQSPSIATILQELIDSYTIDNEAVMFQLRNDKAGEPESTQAWYCDSYHYPSDHSHAPRLVVNFVAPRRIFVTKAG